ncbi:unnamed protein product [Calicophoron daubneyi]|uniref:Saposin B-type domain-containing protein n=1 Tax=Calicophoron daubneyi TaxID=300641 RepID=A0AAV2T5B0_CALDB
MALVPRRKVCRLFLNKEQILPLVWMLCASRSQSVMYHMWRVVRVGQRGITVMKICDAQESAASVGVCDICKGAVGVLLELVKIGASQDIIDEKIGDICPSIPIISSICKEALKKAVKYLREHLDKADANTVCKAIHACNNKHTFIVVNW